MPPVHAGEILLEEFLGPLGVSQYQLAKAVDVPARRVNETVHGQRRITADTALRLARYFGTSERLWMNLQARYDLEVEKDRLGRALDEHTATERRELIRRQNVSLVSPRSRKRD
jgi:addiction module HigA family antidote